MYLTFDEYENLHADSNISESFEIDFPFIEMDVEAYINRRTFNRFKNDTEYPNELKYCVAALIDIIYQQRNLLSLNRESTTEEENRLVTSQSNDGVSITYRSLGAENLEVTLQKQVNTTMESYLFGVRNQKGRLVLYRGLYNDE